MAFFLGREREILRNTIHSHTTQLARRMYHED